MTMVWSTDCENPIESVDSKDKVEVKRKNTCKRSLKRARMYFREYCSNTSIHGLKYLSEKRSICERILWIALILLAFGCCAYLITKIYNKYEDSPFIVSFATRESPIYTIPFPAVTICPITKADKLKFNFTGTMDKLRDNKTLDPYELKTGQYMQLICDHQYPENFDSNGTFTEDFFDTLDRNNVEFDIIFSSCQFMGEDLPCNSLFIPIIVDDGLCYSFNILNRHEIYKDNIVHYANYHQSMNSTTNWSVDKGYPPGAGKHTFPVRALISGADNALQLILTQRKRDIDYLCARDVQGFDVLLHTPNSIPRLKKEFFTVPLDYSVLAMVQPQMMTTSEKVKIFKPKDRECYTSDERFLQYFKLYTPENCQLECLTNYTLELCECVNFFMPRENSTPICGNEQIDCMKAIEYLLKELELSSQLEWTSFLDEIAFVPTCDCMPLCFDLSYEVENTQAPWEWREEFKAARGEQLVGNFNEKMYASKLTIFFKKDRFLTSQRNELYGPTDFLANFGGLLGLFTGFSLLSLAEIIYFLTVRFCCNVMNRNSSKSN